MQIDIVDYLKKLNTSENLYLPNPGNAGDALISVGTMHLFKKLNIKYEFITDRNSFEPGGKTVIYGGGGNLVEYYTNSRSFFIQNHKKLKKLIILPSTISGHTDLLHEFGKNTDIITRELVSYEFVRRHAPKANVYLSHDMSFYIDKEEVMTPSFMGTTQIILKKIFYKIIGSKKIKNVPSPEIYIKSRINELKLKRNQKNMDPEMC